MKSALSDFISGKKGIYGILHIIILVMSLFLVISISVDTFKGIPFYTQSSYMKVQLCICLWFLFDFVLEFFLAKHKGESDCFGRSKSGVTISHFGDVN